MGSLFPNLPEDLSALSDEELSNLLREHEHVASLIEAEDEEFTKGMSADEVLQALETGVSQMEAIVSEQKDRKQREAEYLAEKERLASKLRGLTGMSAEAEGGEADAGTDEEAENAEEMDAKETAELAAEDEHSNEEESVEEGAVLVSSAIVPNTAPRRMLRRPPAPSRDRLPSENVAILTAASGLDGIRGGQPLDRLGLAEAMKTVARRVGPPAKSEAGIQQRFFIGQVVFPFPDERRLLPSDADGNARKIRAVIPNAIPGLPGNPVLTASGGLCAPLEPIYTMPNFATMERPVRDALPSFQAERGGVNVPEATSIGDITEAISVITEEEDSLGGTFATKSCQDLDCPDYREVAVAVISHCREYGNLNARAWPEKIAHENDLTMAAYARTADTFLLNRIKAQSIAVTDTQVVGAYAELVDALVRGSAGIRYRLRLPQGARLRALLPAWLPDLLVADTVRTQFDRFQTQQELSAQLEQYGINAAYYLDSPSTGTFQGFAAEVGASTLDPFPAAAQIALFVEGAFLHLDAGTLDLGIVRDSTLNSTNDFQIFGEGFENVVRIGPAQSALWLEVPLVPTGAFPALV